MLIGEGLMEGRSWAMDKAGANRPEGKGYVIAYGEWLKRFKVDDMDKSDGFSAAEMARARREIERRDARIAELEQELTSARERIAELEQERA